MSHYSLFPLGYLTEQGSANLRQQDVFVNKALLAHGHANLLTTSIWRLSRRAESGVGAGSIPSGLRNSKYPLCRSKKALADLYSRSTGTRGKCMLFYLPSFCPVLWNCKPVHRAACVSQRLSARSFLQVGLSESLFLTSSSFSLVKLSLMSQP